MMCFRFFYKFWSKYCLSHIEKDYPVKATRPDITEDTVWRRLGGTENCRIAGNKYLTGAARREERAALFMIRRLWLG